MADMRKDEEGNAFPEKRKLDLPNSVNETFEQKAELDEVKSESSKRQKLETPVENEANVICSFLIDGKMAETKDGKEDYKADEKGDTDEHLKVEAEIIDRGKRFSAADKGKGILIEESDDEEGDDSGDDSSDDSDSDFSDGLDSGSEDIPF